MAYHATTAFGDRVRIKQRREPDLHIIQLLLGTDYEGQTRTQLCTICQAPLNVTQLSFIIVERRQQQKSLARDAYTYIRIKTHHRHVH